MNAIKIEEAISPFAEQSFEAQKYPYAFLVSFENKAEKLKRFWCSASNRPDLGCIPQAQNIHIAVSHQGDITAPYTVSPLTAEATAKFVLATDGNELETGDLNIVETIACAYKPLNNHVGSSKHLTRNRS